MAPPDREPRPPAATDGRFARQVRFEPLGAEGQARLAGSRVLLVGAGALGGVLAQTLVRCGVGELVLADRDVVDHTNLARQVLFEERHADEGTPKVEAALESLARIGGPTRVEPHAVHVDAGALPRLARRCALVLDGTDNLATRYLINDFCVDRGVPWVYGGVVGSGGTVLAVVPGRGPCLRCLFPDPPPAGRLETCETAGVLLPAVAAVASLQAGLALRLLAAGPEGLEPRLLSVDAWSGDARGVRVERDPDCPTCARGERPYLAADPRRAALVLCGRNAVQVAGSGARPDLPRLERALAGAARDVRRTRSLLRFRVDALAVTVFPDGRALVEGTDDPDRARAAVDRYVGG